MKNELKFNNIISYLDFKPPDDAVISDHADMYPVKDHGTVS